MVLTASALQRIRPLDSGDLVQPPDLLAQVGDSFATTVMLVTPEIAATWLARGGNNRAVIPNHVTFLSEQIADGEWRLTGDSIKLDADGRVRDGQHRLMAVIASKTPILTVVAQGVAEGAFDVMDTGRTRSIKDVVSIHGYKNAAAIGSAAKYVLQWEEHRSLVQQVIAKRVSPSVAAAYVDQHHEELEFWVSWAERIWVHGRIPGGRGLWGALLTIFGRVSNEDAVTFAEKVTTGASLEVGNPILALRRRLQDQRDSRAKVRQEEIAALIIKTWNSFRRGDSVQILRWARGGASPEAFPMPHGVEPRP